MCPVCKNTITNSLIQLMFRLRSVSELGWAGPPCLTQAGAQTTCQPVLLVLLQHPINRQYTPPPHSPEPLTNKRTVTASHTNTQSLSSQIDMTAPHKSARPQWVAVWLCRLGQALGNCHFLPFLLSCWPSTAPHCTALHCGLTYARTGPPPVVSSLLDRAQHSSQQQSSDVRNWSCQPGLTSQQGWCSVRSAVLLKGVLQAVCIVQCAKCIVKSALFTVQCAMCSVQWLSFRAETGRVGVHLNLRSLTLSWGQIQNICLTTILEIYLLLLY